MQWSRDPRLNRGPEWMQWSRDPRLNRGPEWMQWSRDPRLNRGPEWMQWGRDPSSVHPYCYLLFIVFRLISLIRTRVDTFREPLSCSKLFCRI